jgi:hypothetical protein
MNLAIGIGTLLLGGWVLNSPPSDDQRNVTPQTPSKDAKDSAVQTPLPGDQSGNSGMPRGQGPGAGAADSQPAGRASPKGFLPSAPTEPGRTQYGGRYLMPTPPTGLGRDREYGDPAISSNPTGSPMQPDFPDVPTSRQASPPRSADSSYYSERDFWRRQTQSLSYPGFSQPVAPTKPFADARPFSNGVSPYMGLFRNDTAGGTIDNYSTLVRPALDQRGMNQQFNLDIYGLERNARLQEMALRQMSRMRAAERTPQGVSTPQFNRNFGGYYPGTMQQGYGQ